METFKATNEYKQKLYEWKVNQQPRNQYQNCNNSSSTKYIDATQTSYDVTDSRNPILEQIPSNIEYIKAGLMEIKNALKISTNSLGETGAWLYTLHRHEDLLKIMDDDFNYLAP